MSTTISVRVNEEIKKEIEELGHKPGEYIKMILENELQRERAKRALSWLKAHKLPPGKKTVAEEIRGDRDSR
ncbi:MAG: hypothetical protein V3S49_05835 [Thermodesulfobacteriota bacterium]